MNNILFVVIALSFFSCTSSGKITWISSTENQFWNTDNVVEYQDFSTEVTDYIEVFPKQELQTVEYFGACFNELGWDALNLVDSATREYILTEFFSPGKGFNFSACRMPIGANDYARNWYSLNDSAGDFAMNYFSIDRDLTSLIPYIKEALTYNPDLKIWGSPWCPPAWMKTNNHYACRPAPVNDLDEEGKGRENLTQFIMEPVYLKAYADYFAKYIEAYKNQGIDIYSVHVQNEMNSCQNFPSCIWTSKDLATFIGEYLGPKLQTVYPEVEIWYGTVERPYVEKVDTILEDNKASQYVKGVGFQWAGKHCIPGVNEKYPEMDLMQTESECGNGSNDWAAAEYTFSLIKHYMNNGANSYMYWNMILDETGKSQWGWKQNSLISVDSKTGKVTYNPEYYLFKHFTSKVQQNAHMLEISDKDQDLLAFQNPDETIVLFTVNTLEESKKLKVKVGDKMVETTLAPKSFHTITLN